VLHVIAITALVLALAERVPPLWRRRLQLFRPHALADLAFLVVAWIAIGQLTLPWVGRATRWVGATTVEGMPFWLETLLALVLLDLGNYVAHWLMHRCPILWRVHAVHHSSPALDWLATFRSHVLDQLLRRLVAPLGLIVLGLSPPAVAIASSVFLAWAVFAHANLRVNLRFLEPVLITPRLHHLHHVAASADQNLGTFLSVWDRITRRLVHHDVPPDIALGNGHAGYPQSFGALMREPFQSRTRAVRLERSEKCE
jgi:sterol desaturase/sphingolipid hydroxylase (fatty acid hydroxylase superfamily)